jgi:hypothetical protein
MLAICWRTYAVLAWRHAIVQSFNQPCTAAMQAAMAPCMAPCLFAHPAPRITHNSCCSYNFLQHLHTRPNNLFTHTHKTSWHATNLFTSAPKLHLHTHPNNLFTRTQTTSSHAPKQPLHTRPNNIFTRTQTTFSHRNNIITRTQHLAQSRHHLFTLSSTSGH